MINKSLTKIMQQFEFPNVYILTKRQKDKKTKDKRKNKDNMK